jgi:hypothetical protein
MMRPVARRKQVFELMPERKFEKIAVEPLIGAVLIGQVHRRQFFLL